MKIYELDVVPLAAPSIAVQIDRLHALMEAANTTASLWGVTAFDGQAGMARMREHMAVIANAYHEGTEEINRCARESEGTVECDPWFRLLRHQGMVASAWIEHEASIAVSGSIWNATRQSPDAV